MSTPTPNWDAERIFGCSCDLAYTGYDCSLRKCVYGDDPSVGGGNDEIQRISCTATSGTFNVKFRGHLTKTLNFNDSPSTLQAALIDLPTIRGLELTVFRWFRRCFECQLSGGVRSGQYWLVTFTSVPGDVPDLLFPKEAASGQPAYVSTTREADTTSHECSNRGKCTRTGDNAGQCVCQMGIQVVMALALMPQAVQVTVLFLFLPAALETQALLIACGHGTCSANVCTCDSLYWLRLLLAYVSQRACVV